MTAMKWTCFHCGAANEDDPDLTAVPLCAGCQKDVWWEETSLGEVETYSADTPSFLLLLEGMRLAEQIRQKEERGEDITRLRQQMNNLYVRLDKANK